MACCGKKRGAAGITQRSALLNLNRRLVVQRPVSTVLPARKPVSVLTTLCSEVANKGEALPVQINNTLLLVTVENVRFELFSAVKSQGCVYPPWLSRLDVLWHRSRVTTKKALAREIGNKPIQAAQLIAKLTALAPPQ